MKAQFPQQKKAEKMKNFSGRLKYLRELRGFSQADLATSLGLSVGSVGNWEAMFNMPTTRRLKLVAEKMGVSVDYLLGREPIEKANLSVPPSKIGSRPAYRVPVASWANAARADGHSEICEFLDEVIDTDCSDPNGFGLIVEGDSMEPRFSAGDRIVVAPNLPARNGQVVVARLAGDAGLLFKLYHATGRDGQVVRLTSYNPVYPPLEFERKQFQYLYAVHSVVRKLV
ncbi:MAG: S24 family peptidase [Verrucomicrobiota bacterium]